MTEGLDTLLTAPPPPWVGAVSPADRRPAGASGHGPAQVLLGFDCEHRWDSVRLLSAGSPVPLPAQPARLWRAGRLDRLALLTRAPFRLVLSRLVLSRLLTLQDRDQRRRGTVLLQQGWVVGVVVGKLPGHARLLRLLRARRTRRGDVGVVRRGDRPGGAEQQEPVSYTHLTLPTIY